MSKQIDLTYEDPVYTGLLLGAVTTRYDDGDLYTSGYDIDIREYGNPQQVESSTWIEAHQVKEFRDWLDEVL